MQLLEIETTINYTSKPSIYIFKPNYYNKFAKQPKPKTSNSIVLISSPY